MHWEYVTVIDYAGGFILHGEEDPTQKRMEEIMKITEDIQWDMPEGVDNWSEKTQASVKGNLVTKTVTRTLYFKDKHTEEITKTVEYNL